ncbi:hypothetical protein [Streptomyces sp. TP-A0356]
MLRSRGGGELGQGAVFVGSLAEGPEQQGGLTDGGQALAPHVTWAG